MKKKPNIILIFSDQHRGDAMGCVNHPVILTPRLDRLAREGATFTDCCTNSPVCMPARASLMSGQYVNQHGVWSNIFNPDCRGPSHVRNIRDAGFHTALIGKTHLYVHRQGDHVNNHLEEMRSWGYEYSLELGGTVSAELMDDPWTEMLAEKKLLQEYRRSIIDFQRVNWGFIRKPWEDPPAPLPTECHIDAYTGQKAVEWISNYDDEDRPFYLQVLFPGPHPPFNSAPEYRALYPPEDMPVGTMEKLNPPVSRLVDFVRRWSNLDGMTAHQKQVLLASYYAKITLIDEQIGRILDSLEQKKLLDDTWIIYSSDHGEMAGDHLLSQKLTFFEEALNVPLIVRPPGGIQGLTSRGLTDHFDLIATLLEIAGAQPLTLCEGQSLLSGIQAGSVDPSVQIGKERVFSEVAGYSMVRTDRYKLVVESGTRRPTELYDLAEDPKELHNLAEEKSCRKIRGELIDCHLNSLLENMDGEKLKKFQTREAARPPHMRRV